MAKPKSLPYDAPEAEGPYSVGLYSQAGGSDKLYNLSIEPAGDGLWVVNYANGRRGKPLQSGTKTSSPVAYADARAILNDTLYSKVGSGYVPISGSRFGDGMTAEAIATIARESSGHLPQLLNPVGEEDLEALLEDDRYAAEVKHDGERRFVIVVGGRATGGNRTRRGRGASVHRRRRPRRRAGRRHLLVLGHRLLRRQGPQVVAVA